MTDNTQYTPPAWPTIPPLPPKKSHWVRNTFLILGCALGGLFIAGVIVAVTSTPAPVGPTHSVNTDTSASTDAQPAPAGPQASDFTVDLKVTTKQCFDTYGCNITVQPKLTYAKALSDLDGKTCQITYSITGDQSGAIIGTVNSVGSQITGFPTVLTTNTSSTPVGATVTVVDCN